MNRSAADVWVARDRHLCAEELWPSSPVTARGGMEWAHRYERVPLDSDHQAGACAVQEPIARNIRLSGLWEQLGACLTRRMLLLFEDDNERRFCVCVRLLVLRPRRYEVDDKKFHTIFHLPKPGSLALVVYARITADQLDPTQWE